MQNIEHSNNGTNTYRLCIYKGPVVLTRQQTGLNCKFIGETIFEHLRCARIPHCFKDRSGLSPQVSAAALCMHLLTT